MWAVPRIINDSENIYQATSNTWRQADADAAMRPCSQAHAGVAGGSRRIDDEIVPGQTEAANYQG